MGPREYYHPMMTMMLIEISSMPILVQSLLLEMTKQLTVMNRGILQEEAQASGKEVLQDLQEVKSHKIAVLQKSTEL